MRSREAPRTVLHPELDVNTWQANDPDVEAARLGACVVCDGAAHRADGRLRLHGHGRRRRDWWGQAQPDGPPMLGDILVRRYRCTDCGAVLTVLPRGMVAAVRTTLATIAMALWLWAIRGWTAAKTRRATSPLRHVGSSEPHRWRSLRRWTLDADRLFGLPIQPSLAPPREHAARVVHLLIARGPPEGPWRHRLWQGAQAR